MLAGKHFDIALRLTDLELKLKYEQEKCKFEVKSVIPSYVNFAFPLPATYEKFGQKYLLGVASNHGHVRFKVRMHSRYRRRHSCVCDNLHISYGGDITSKTGFGRR